MENKKHFVCLHCIHLENVFAVGLIGYSSCGIQMDLCDIQVHTYFRGGEKSCFECLGSWVDLIWLGLLLVDIENIS